MDPYAQINQASSSSTLNSQVSLMSQTTMNQHGQQLELEQQQRLMAEMGQPMQSQPTRHMNQRDKLFMYHLNQYYLTKSTERSRNISETIQEVVKIVHDVLRELEIQEPRFVSTFTEINGHYEGKWA